MLVSKKNEGMKKKKKRWKRGEGKYSVYFGWFNNFSNQPEVCTEACPQP